MNAFPSILRRGLPNPVRAFAVGATSCFAMLALTLGLNAGVAEPDHILYGRITVDGIAIRGADTDIRVEARRLISGPAVVTYRMGSNPLAGDYYSLRFPLESGVPLVDPNASLVGDSLFIVVVDASGIVGQITYTLTDRGMAERRDLNFGSTITDSDQDTLPDAWENEHYGGLLAQPDTRNVNGQTAGQDYVAGTDPNDASSVFEVAVTEATGEVQVFFLARRASGVGYEGLQRYYSLESTGDFSEVWRGVAGYTNLLGNQQIVRYRGFATNPPTYYRGRVWLERP